MQPYSEDPQVAPSKAPVVVTNDLEGLQLACRLIEEKADPFVGCREYSADHKQISRVQIRWWILGLVAAGVCGLVLGIGIGDVIGRRSDSVAVNPTATVTATLTALSPTSGTSTALCAATDTSKIPGVLCVASNNCDASATNPTYTSSNYTFHEVCASDYPNGWGIYNPDNWAIYNGSTGTSDNLKTVLSYTWESCMDECANYNKAVSAPQLLCLAVSYNANLTMSPDANCFLKPYRTELYAPSNYSLCASAYTESLDT